MGEKKGTWWDAPQTVYDLWDPTPKPLKINELDN